DMKTGKYDVSSTLHLKQPKGFPALKVLRTSKMSNYKVNKKPVEKFILKKHPDKNAIKGILNRLDEEDKPSVPDNKPSNKPSNKKESSEFPPGPQWDINKIIQEMQMREMIQEDTETMSLP
ncbi:MAG: hypothetical protein KAH96_04575, partial [Alphaproteobacteria bacterium]|nr:hypothetical protein [Alphaproteobacteria bacterium]